MKNSTILLPLVLCCSALLLSSAARAAPTLTIECDEPVGPRLDYRAELSTSTRPGFAQSEDRYSGVKPVFIVDDTRPAIITYVWGESALAKALSPTGEPRPTAAMDARIVVDTDDILSATEVFSSNRISVFTFLPKAGVGVFTDHTYTDVLGPNFKAVTFTAKCRFSRR